MIWIELCVVLIVFSMSVLVLLLGEKVDLMIWVVGVL